MAQRRREFAELTPTGHEVLEETAPGHVAEVRRRVFDQLDDEEVAQLRAIATKLGDAAGG